MTAPTSQLCIRIADENLPVLSAVANEARVLINKGDTTPAKLEALIRKDASLSSQILVLANSPIYGGRVKFSSISQAVVRLGMQALGKAIVVAAAGNIFPKDDDFATDLWEHSVAVAVSARWLSQRIEKQDPEEAFLAGVVHDVGKILIYSQFPDEYRRLFEEAANMKIPFHRHEKTLIPVQGHEWVGGFLARKWGLAKPIVEVMRSHNRVESDENISEETREFVALVSLANLLAKKLGYSPEPELEDDLTASIPFRLLGIETTVLYEAENDLPALIDDQLMSFG